MHRAILPMLLFILVCHSPLSAQFNQKWGVPGSPTGQKVAVILEMVDRGDDDFTREMLGTHFAEAFVALKSMEEHFAEFRRLHEDLPELRPAGVMRTDTGARFRARSEASGQAVSFTFQVDDGGRIAGLEVDMGSGGPGRAGGPRRPLPEQLEEWTEAGEFSGVVFDFRDGETLFAQAYGLADRRYDIPNTLDTAFNLGSLIKAFTGAAIMLLEEDGRVDLDAPLGDYVDGFPEDIAQKVTVRHLLQHRSGWGHYWDNETFLENLGEMREMSDYLAFIREIPLGFEPGTDREYSNVGYEVLGGVIKAASGMSYYDFVQERIFDPLGMTRSGFPMRDQPARGVAVGYTKQHPDAVEEGYSMENTFLLAPRGTAGGGGYSTVEDLQRFWLGLADGKIAGERGFSMVLGEYDETAGTPRGETVRAGGGPGVMAVILFNPGERRFAAVLSNFDSELVSQVIERFEDRR